RLKCWNTMPIERRTERRARSPSCATSVPSTMTRPAVGFSSPLTRRISVDLPAPERPMTPTMELRGTSRSMPASACTAAELLRAGKDLATPSKRMMASSASSLGGIAASAAMGEWAFTVILFPGACGGLAALCRHSAAGASPPLIILQREAGGALGRPRIGEDTAFERLVSARRGVEAEPLPLARQDAGRFAAHLDDIGVEH